MESEVTSISSLKISPLSTKKILLCLPSELKLLDSAYESFPCE